MVELPEDRSHASRPQGAGRAGQDLRAPPGQGGSRQNQRGDGELGRREGDRLQRLHRRQQPEDPLSRRAGLFPHPQQQRHQGVRRGGIELRPARMHLPRADPSRQREARPRRQRHVARIPVVELRHEVPLRQHVRRSRGGKLPHLRNEVRRREHHRHEHRQPAAGPFGRRTEERRAGRNATVGRTRDRRPLDAQLPARASRPSATGRSRRGGRTPTCGST